MHARGLKRRIAPGQPLLIRGPSGFGDSLYMRPIVDYYVRRGHAVTVKSNFPEVFEGSNATVTPFVRHGDVDVLAHYVYGKSNTETTQFEDMCRCAGISEKIPLRFEWTVKNPALVADLRTRAAGRKVVVVHGGRTPMGRKDGFGKELLPQKPAFDATLEEFRDCFTVRVGHDQVYALRTELDLQGKTSIADLIDIVSISDAVVAQCSLAVPLSEGLGRPLLVVWSSAGLKARTSYIRAVTPKKILSAGTSRYVMDDWPVERIRAEARAFRESLR